MSIDNITDIYKNNDDVIEEAALERTSRNDDPNTPDSEKFENDVWLFFKNFDSKIKIINRKHSTSKIIFGNESQQIDVLAISESLAFICEVTTQETISEKLEDMIGWKKKLEDNDIENHIHMDPHIVFGDKEIIWLLFSKNDVTETMRTRARGYGIRILIGDDVSYMEQVIKSYGNKRSLAFVPFLSNVLNIQVNVGSDVEVPAIRYIHENDTYSFSFICHPDFLLDRCTVIHRRSERKMDKSYQRFVDTTKIGKVTRFVQNNPQFANNIILSSLSMEAHADNFKKTSDQPEVSLTGNTSNPPELGILKLPNFFGDMSVIDGQHRLFGYSGSGKEKTHYVNCLLFDKSLQRKDQQMLFKNINENQKALTSNHIWELNEDTLESGHKKQVISKFFNQFLNEEDLNFALFGKVKMGNTIHRRGKGEIKLSYTNIGSTMSTYVKEGRQDPALFQYLLNLFHSAPDQEQQFFKISELLNGYFKVLKNNCEDDWNVNSQGIIFTGSTFQALMWIFREILHEWDSDNTLSEKLRNLNNIHEHFEYYLKPICDFINEFETPPQKTEWKKQSLGSGGPKVAANLLVKEIQSRKPELNGFAADLLTETIYSPEYTFINEILTNKDEVIDIEAKSEIFVRNLAPTQQNKLAKEEILAHIGAMHHTLGGFLIVGLDPDNYSVIGCDEELSSHQGFGRWKDKVYGFIMQCSENRIEVEITKEVIEDKTVVIIQVPMISDEDLEAINWVKWKYSNNDFHLKVRQQGRSKKFDDIGRESDIREYIQRIRSKITDEGEFFNSMLDYEEYRKNHQTSYVTMYNSHKRLKY